MILAVVLRIALPIVVVGALVLVVAGRRGRRFLRILLLEQPGRMARARGPRRARTLSYLAIAFGALCAVKGAETAATSTSQLWLVWTMAVLAAVLVLGGAVGLTVTRRRPSPETVRDRTFHT